MVPIAERIRARRAPDSQPIVSAGNCSAALLLLLRRFRLDFGRVRRHHLDVGGVGGRSGGLLGGDQPGEIAKLRAQARLLAAQVAQVVEASAAYVPRS